MDLDPAFVGFLFGVASSLATVLVVCVGYSRVSGQRAPLFHYPMNIEQTANPYIVRTEQEELEIERDAIRRQNKKVMDEVPGLGRNS